MRLATIVSLQLTEFATVLKDQSQASRPSECSICGFTPRVSPRCTVFTRVIPPRALLQWLPIRKQPWIKVIMQSRRSRISCLRRRRKRKRFRLSKSPWKHRLTKFESRPVKFIMQTYLPKTKSKKWTKPSKPRNRRLKTPFDRLKTFKDRWQSWSLTRKS